jgi:hypothetical protein
VRFTTYYSNASSFAGAEALRLEAGEDRPRVNFVVAAARAAGPLGALTLTNPLAERPGGRPGQVSTGSIRGHVVGPDGRGVPRAVVRLTVSANPRQTISTRADADGRFSFDELPGASYRILALQYGFSPPGTTAAIDLAEGERNERVVVRLEKWGSISGRVVDERGDPLQGATVQTLQVRYQAGKRRLVAAGGAAMTNDLGAYEIFNLRPGRYAVSASGALVAPLARVNSDTESSELPGYARTFYPATAAAGEAVFLAVGAAQEVTNIDVRMSRTRTARITGRLLDSAGQPSSRGSVLLFPSQASPSPTFVGTGARLRP